MKLSYLAKKMILVICISSVLFIVAGAVYHRSLLALPFALGVVLGAALNVAKVVMLERVVKKAVTMESKDAGNYVKLQYLLRLLLTAGLFMLGALTSFVSLWGAAAGILTFQIAAFCMKFFIGKDEALDIQDDIPDLPAVPDVQNDGIQKDDVSNEKA